MEFSLDDFNRIMMHLANEPSVHVHHNNSNPLTTVKDEPSILNEQPTSTNNTSDRQYCLIIFNNPSWSQRLRKGSSKVIEKILNIQSK
jgi:hypothetical protein